jgi:hypothetical protein
MREYYSSVDLHLKKPEKKEIYNLMIYLKVLEEQEQANPKINRRKEIINTRIKIYKWKLKE